MKIEDFKITEPTEVYSVIPLIYDNLRFSEDKLIVVKNAKIAKIWNEIFEKYSYFLSSNLKRFVANWHDLPVDYYWELDYNRDPRDEYTISDYIREEVNSEIEYAFTEDASSGCLLNIPIIKSFKGAEIGVLASINDKITSWDKDDSYETIRKYFTLIFAQRVDYLNLNYREVNKSISNFPKKYNPEVIKQFIHDSKRKTKLSIFTLYKNVDDRLKKHTLKTACGDLHKILSMKESLYPESYVEAKYDIDNILIENNAVIMENMFNSPFTSSIMNEYFNGSTHYGRFDCFLCKGKEIVSRKKAVMNRNSFLAVIDKMMKTVEESPENENFILIISFINYVGEDIYKKKEEKKEN